MPSGSLTIVLPAYNEEARMGPALDVLFGYLHRPAAGGPGGGAGLQRCLLHRPASRSSWVSIYQMLAYASARLRTTLLTNAMLLRGTRLAKLSRRSPTPTRSCRSAWTARRPSSTTPTAGLGRLGAEDGRGDSRLLQDNRLPRTALDNRDPSQRLRTWSRFAPSTASWAPRVRTTHRPLAPRSPSTQGYELKHGHRKPRADGELRRRVLAPPLHGRRHAGQQADVPALRRPVGSSSTRQNLPHRAAP